MARKKTVKSASNTTDLANPQNRTEEFLAKIAGLVDTLPQGEFSRLERYLKYIAENGGGGGGGGVTSFNTRTGAVEPQSGDYSSFYAPSGFGLGSSTAKVLSSTDDLDDITDGGFYSWATVPINSPSNRIGCMIVLPPTSVGAMLTQIVYAKAGGTTGVNNFITVRCYNPGTNAWGPWEWFNPPLNITSGQTASDEFRTTERFLVKPVYVKVIDCGTHADSETLPFYWNTLHGISNLKEIVSCNIQASYTQAGSSTVYPITLPFYDSTGLVLVGWADILRVEMYLYKKTLGVTSTYSAKAIIKYTKTTD